MAWVKVSQKARLRVVAVDGPCRPFDERPCGATREFPSLVLIVRRRDVVRLQGRATGQEIDQLLRAHLPA